MCFSISCINLFSRFCIYPVQLQRIPSIPSESERSENLKFFYPDNLSDAMSDENLVLLTLAGDTDAYDRLVLRWETAVVNAALSVCNNRELARDAAQDAFVTAWMKLANLSDGTKYGAWTCRIARNCALQLLTRYRYYTGEISTDDEEVAYRMAAKEADPAERTTQHAENKLLHEAIGTLSEKVRQIIRLYYLENHSIDEIAEMLGVTSGTVKRQLWDGRRKIRKELCAMDETATDTLLERVHKKVEEVKSWQYLDKKDSFPAVYRDALAAIEELPESGERILRSKYHAMADVLLRGWWWIPGEKNDALFAQIREAAFAGGNEEVIAAVITEEDRKLWGNARIQYMKDTQIPVLEKAGYNKALAQEYFWLGTLYLFDEASEKKMTEGVAALEKTLSLTGVDDPLHAFARVVLDLEKVWEEQYKDAPMRSYRMSAGITELRRENGVWRSWQNDWNGCGYLCSFDTEADFLLDNMAEDCDHYLIKPDLAPGETWYSSAGAKITHVSDSETVDTPCGTFHDCSLWEKTKQETRVRTWFCDGVGIVRQDHIVSGIAETRMLAEYCIQGGTGRLPLATGNRWIYRSGTPSDVLSQFCQLAVVYADAERANVTMRRDIRRFQYDENDFRDTMAMIRNEYAVNEEEGYVADMADAMQRAEALAKTPFEKAYAAAANDVMRRLSGCRNGCLANRDNMTLPIGRWNFFDYVAVTTENSKTSLSRDFRWSFEWKGDKEGACEGLLMNDIFMILADTAGGFIWNTEWEKPGTHTVEYLLWKSHAMHAEITAEDIGEYTVRAGTFTDCKRLTVDCTGFKGGLSYRNGKRTYILAPGIGILQVKNPYAHDTRTATYELTAYTGVGEGYMPFFSGMERTYTGIDLTDGMVGWSKYHCMTADDGTCILLCNRCGIEEPIQVTQYSSVEREKQAEILSGEAEYLRRRVNQLHTFAHMLSNSIYSNDPYALYLQGKLKIDALRSLQDADGEVPQGWWQLYASRLFSSSCHYFGAIYTANCSGEQYVHYREAIGLPLEEGYAMLEKAIALYRKWIEIPDGTLLPLGHPALFGDARLVKGKPVIELPDGTRELLDYGCGYYTRDPKELYYGMTAQQGWEWFNGVRNEERFQKDVVLAKELMDTAAKGK